MNKSSSLLGCLQRLKITTSTCSSKPVSFNGLQTGIYCATGKRLASSAVGTESLSSSGLTMSSGPRLASIHKLTSPLRCWPISKDVGLLRASAFRQAPCQQRRTFISGITHDQVEDKNRLLVPLSVLSDQLRSMATLNQMHRMGPPKKKCKKKRPLNGKPYAKGVVLKTLIKKPKKPNSANRKCVLVKLSIGKEAVAHVPGEGHNLQEHNIVLVRVGRLKDVPGVKLKVVRGKYDCGHVVKKTQTV